MAKFDLNKLTLAELKALEKDVAKAISGFEAKRLADARQAIEAAAKEHGFALHELIGTKKTRLPVPAKYCNPDDASQTWTGRGRQPGWVKQALDGGKELTDLAI